MGGGSAPGDLAAAVRRHDADRYIATLYAPHLRRPALWAVYAFAAELAQVPGLVSQSGLGEIRLQWWRQNLDDLGHDRIAGRHDGDPEHNPSGHPVIDALAPVVRTSPIIAGWLQAMIDGRSTDLYADPMDNMTALEAYFGATLSLPVRVAIYLLAPGAGERRAADAAGHGGVVLGYTHMASHLADVVNRRPELIPLEILNCHGLTIADLRSPQGGPGLRLILADLQSAALRHLDQAVGEAHGLPVNALPALLPLAPLRGDLARIAGREPKPGGTARRGALYRQWTMWRAARRGSVL